MLFLYGTTVTFANGDAAHGWGFIWEGTASEPTFSYTIRDADTGAAISPDSLTIELSDLDSGGAIVASLYCSSSCPSSGTLTGIPPFRVINQRIMASKAGYEFAYNPGGHVLDPWYDPSTHLTTNVYMQKTGQPPVMDVISPDADWYSYTPSVISRSYAPFWNTTWGGPRPSRLYAYLDNFTQTLATSPFPKDVTMPGPSSWNTFEGWITTWSTEADAVPACRSSGSESTTNCYITSYAIDVEFGIDRRVPAASCSLSLAGPTTLNVNLNASDALPGSGLQSGYVEVSVNGGPWEVTGIPNGGNTMSSFSYTYNPVNAYQFRFRARDWAITSAQGSPVVRDHWSAYSMCNLAASATPTPTPSATPSSTDTTAPVILIDPWFVQSCITDPASQPRVEAQVVDAGVGASGVDTVTFRLNGVETIATLDVGRPDGRTNMYSIPFTPSGFGTYEYFVKATDIAGNLRDYTPVALIRILYTNACVAPWIQTAGGDVHSNTNLDTPGGPP